MRRGPGDHQLFVRADDPNLDRPLVGRDQKAPDAFRPSSRAIPRNPSPAQIRRRISAACSPIPPANTSESIPPSAAA